MKFPFLISGTVRRIAVLCLLATGFPSPAHGQINAIKKAATPEQPAAPAAPEKPEEIRKRLELWLQEARDTLARLDAPGAAAGLPQGVTPEELDDRRRDLEQMILTAGRSIKNLNSVAEARKELESSRAEDTAWTGFTENPPYSVLMIDELLNERDATATNLTSSQSSLANYERLLTSLRAEAKSAEEDVSTKLLAMQSADDTTRDAAKWRMEAARAKTRMLAARAGLMQSIHDSLKDRINAATTDLALIDRKIKVAKASSHFNSEDLAKIEKLSEERKAAAQKELDGYAKRLKSALVARNQAQAALDALVAATPPDPQGLELAKFRLEVTEGRVEAMQSLAEGCESLIQLENISYKAYQDRKAIFDATNPEQKAKALESLGLLVERLVAWENVASNDIAASSADLSKLESRAASITSDDPRFNLLNEQRAIKSEMLAMLQRISQAVIAQQKLVDRWIEDNTPKSGQELPFHRVRKLGATTWDTLQKIWDFQVTNYVDSVEVDGQTITGRIPVTLGMLLRALLFFVIGYWIATKIANRVQGTLVTRGHIAETNARMLRNWMMIVVGIFLAIGTLSFLKIPLTIFAFFGGALAIGIGFGMQTLIKNFISGIIVLAERKIRVGDVLDVDGIVGTVVEVNTRSSIIKSADDVETMIPNSVFLENRVTNWTLTSNKMRRSIRVGVSYGTQPQKVMEILTEAADRHGLIIKDPAPFATFEDFGDNALIFNLYFWIRLGGGTSGTVVASDLRLMIDKRFTETGIGVPYPQRDMHLTTTHPIQVQLTSAPAANPDPDA